MIGLCIWCCEPVMEQEPHEKRAVLDQAALAGCDLALAVCVIHRACAVRWRMGSVGHQQKKCPCYGGTEGDPPGVSKRAAADAAESETLLWIQEGPGGW